MISKKQKHFPKEVQDFLNDNFIFNREKFEIIIDPLDGMLIYNGNFLFERRKHRTEIPKAFLYFKEFTGTLSFWGCYNIINIENLRNLRRVKNLVFEETAIESLNGLENLEYAEVISVLNCFNLKTLDGLNPYINTNCGIYTDIENVIEWRKSKILKNILENL